MLFKNKKTIKNLQKMLNEKLNNNCDIIKYIHTFKDFYF